MRQPPATDVCTKWCERIVHCAVCQTQITPRSQRSDGDALLRLRLSRLFERADGRSSVARRVG